MARRGRPSLLKPENDEVCDWLLCSDAGEGRPFIKDAAGQDVKDTEPQSQTFDNNTSLTEKLYIQSHMAPRRRQVTPPATTLARGTACLPCRRRKMRCDGAKPSCGQCARTGRAEDCEYTADMQGLTRTQMLEENIALLEARIRELEDPDAEGSSVRLHNPLPLVPVEVLQQNEAHPGEEPFQLADFLSSPSLGALPAMPVQPEPTDQDIHALITTFLPYASQTGFFLSIPRFLMVAEHYNSRSPTTHPSGALFEPLMSTVCLWGAVISTEEHLKRYENYLVNRSVQLLSSAIFDANNDAGTHGHAIVGVIQAEVLLANYLFSVGRLLEGRYHSSAAAALCVSCRLHVLSTATDAVSAGESVNAFWTVYALDTVWAAALGSVSALNELALPTASRPDLAVTTPWPLSMADYENGHQQNFHPTARPLASFLSGIDADADAPSLSPTTLRAKAAALFAYASLIAARYRSDMTMLQDAAFWEDFTAADGLITHLASQLPTVTDDLDMLVATTLSRVATIQLHGRFAETNARSRDACIACAHSVAALVGSLGPEVRLLDPIMAMLLSAACQVFVKELRMQAAAGYGGGQAYVGTLIESLERILHVMTAFGAVCPLMSAQAEMVREMRAIA
ncbi:hypothetical protein BDW22DRAFT_1218263 [Trametopsis cervina]|nr:hypothetical protein BDW22DRAFT_1218263 [Trametopsis cervina]